MQISILSLIPKSWIIDDLGDKIRVYYIVKRGHKYANPRPVTFSKIMEIDENFIEGMALYLGDGSFQKNKAHACFANKDKDVCRFMWDFFRERFGLSANDISCFVCYHYENPNISQDWSAALHIPKTKFKIKYSNRHKCEALTLQINRTIFRQVFEALTMKILELNFLKNNKLRRAFLRGLFAAEGCVGVATTDSPKPYINSISYHLSFYENKLANLIIKALELENINCCVVRKEKDHSTVIKATGWDNYWKLWRTGIFDLCERKRAKFLTVAKDLEVNCFLSKNFRTKLFSNTILLQKELAKQLNSWQGNVSKMIKGELGITLDRLLILSRLSGICPEEIKRHVEKAMVGRLTPINDRSFVELAFNLKTNQAIPCF